MRNVGGGWRRRVRSRNELFRAPEMWPLVGVAIVLLIVFMVGTAKPSHYGVSVDMVQSRFARKMRQAAREDAIQVSITRDGRVYFGVMQVTPDYLPEEIRASLRAGAEKRVYLQVDRRATYGDISAVPDQVSLAGVEKVSFLTN